MADGRPFVGRTDELDAVRDALAGASESGLAAVLVHGPPGIGKTALIDAFLNETDAIVLRTTCTEGSGRPLAALGQAIGALGDSDAHGVVDDDEALDRGSERRSRLLAKALELVSDRVRAGPTVLVVDDVQWVDEASADALLYVVRAMLDAQFAGSLSIALTARPGPWAPAPHRLIDALDAEPWFRGIELGGLDRFVLHDLVIALTGQRPSRPLLSLLQDASDGNPMLVASLLRRLDDFGVLGRRGDLLIARGRIDAVAGPQDLDALLREQFGNLSAPCVDLLTRAAFLGDGARLDDLCALVSIDAARVDELLAEATAARVVRQHPDVIEFVHPQLRQVLLHRPRGRRRRQLHASIAQHLADTDDGTAMRAIAVAHHLRRAGDEADRELLLRWTLAAAHHATTLAAWGEAARSYDTALEAASATEVSDAFLAVLRGRAAHAHWFDLDNPAALEHARHAIALAKRVGDQRIWARALQTMARAMWSSEEAAFGTAADLSPFAELLAVATSAEASSLCHYLIATLSYHAGRLDDAALHIDCALETPVVDPVLAAEMHNIKGMVELAMLRLSTAVDALGEAVTLARDHGDPWLMGATTRALAMANLVRGDLDEAESLARDASALASSAAAWAEQALALAVGTSVAAARGNLTEAERLGQTCAVRLRWAGYPTGAQILFPALANARARAGDVDGALRAVDELEAAGARGIALFRALVLAAAGRGVPPVRRRAPRAEPTLFDLAPTAAAAELARANGDEQALRELAPALLRFEAAGVRSHWGWPFDIAELALAARRAAVD